MITLSSSATYLIVGDSIPEEILHSVELIDLILVDGSNLSVKELRSVLARASQSPLGERRLLAITSVEQLSEVMQNTLLKILEEPPKHLTIVLQTSLQERLLPTVRSRLSVINGLDQEKLEKLEVPRLSDLAGFKDRATLKRALDGIRQDLRSQINGNDPKAILANLNQIERAQNRLSQNCNQKLVLDSLLLHWTDVSGKEKSGD